MTFSVSHRRNRDVYPESEEEVALQVDIPLDRLPEVIRAIWASSDFRKETDWVELIPDEEGG